MQEARLKVSPGLMGKAEPQLIGSARPPAGLQRVQEQTGGSPAGAREALSHHLVFSYSGHRNLQWWPSTQVLNLLHPVSHSAGSGGSLIPHTYGYSTSNHLVQEVRKPETMTEHNFGYFEFFFKVCVFI